MHLALVVATAGLALAGCATPRDVAESPTSGRLADATSTLPPGVAVEATDARPADSGAILAEMSDAGASTTDERDERHGEVDGRSWTLVTTVRGTSMCLRLGWDDVTAQWDVCYPLEYADRPMAWTNPTPPPGDHREMMFVVGLAPRATVHLRVIRGDLVVGEADAFEGGTLVVDRAGFAIPVVVESRQALLSPVTLPGDDLTAGVLVPIEVVATDASGDELVRSGATTGASAALVCVDNGAAMLEWSGVCLSPEFPWPAVGYQSGHLLVPATTDAATVELLRDGAVVASHATVLVTPPPGESWPSLAVAGFVVPFATDWYPYEVRSLDANGRVLETISLFGGDGEIPSSL